MKKKNVLIMCIMLLVSMLVIDVKAEDFEGYYIIEKENSFGEIYDEMPTEVKKGDVITVKGIIKNIRGWKIYEGSSTISWDDTAFEIVETNGNYVNVINNFVDVDNYYFVDENKLQISYVWTGDKSESVEEEVFEYKFRVLKETKDGIYGIRQSYDDYGYISAIAGDLVIDEDDNVYDYLEYQYGYNHVLKYQVGRANLSKNYSNDLVNNSTYIIGNHMFTREGSDEYDGVLTTDYIMLASKSIESNDKSDMIIYFKNARGRWINAITNEEIADVPSDFKITYINMKDSYLKNGYYTDSSDRYIIQIVQVDDDNVIVRIDTMDELVRSIGDINNNVISFSNGGKDYQITVNNDNLTVETNDPYLTPRTFTKRANCLVKDFYNDLFGYYDSMNLGNAITYLKSEQSGMYSYGDYEIYVNRTSYDSLAIRFKEKGTDTYLYDFYANLIEFANPNKYEFNYYYTANEYYSYTLEFVNGNVVLRSDDFTTYNGTYTKSKSISLEEALTIWNVNSTSYRVTFDFSQLFDYEISEYYLFGDTIWEFFEDVDGYTFDGWYLGENKYDFDTIVTKPITLKGKWIANNYTVTFNSDGGTEIESQTVEYGSKVDVPTNPVKEDLAFKGWYLNDEEYDFDTMVTCDITLVAHWGDRTYTVTFDSNGGTTISSQNVEQGSKVTKPTDPTKDGHTFAGWFIDEEEYDFDTLVTGAITLVAKWNVNSYTVTFDSDGGTEIESQTVEYGSKVTKPTDPIKDDASFIGWYLNDEEYNFDTLVTSDISLKAKYS